MTRAINNKFMIINGLYAMYSIATVFVLGLFCNNSLIFIKGDHLIPTFFMIILGAVVLKPKKNFYHRLISIFLFIYFTASVVSNGIGPPSTKFFSVFDRIGEIFLNCLFMIFYIPGFLITAFLLLKLLEFFEVKLHPTVLGLLKNSDKEKT